MRQGLHSHMLLAQLAAGLAAGLPAPGTSDAKRLLPLLAKPVVDARTPEVQAEQRQVREAMKLSRRQQRKQKQERQRTESAIHRAIVDALDTGTGVTTTAYTGSEFVTRRLDLSLIHEPRRRAKLSAIATSKETTP